MEQLLSEHIEQLSWSTSSSWSPGAHGPSFPTLSSVQDMTRGILSHAAAAASSVTDAVSSVTSGTGGGGGGGAGVMTSSSVTPPPRRVMESKDHSKILLIIDDKHNDWSVTQIIISVFYLYFSPLPSLSLSKSGTGIDRFV